MARREQPFRPRFYSLVMVETSSPSYIWTVSRGAKQLGLLVQRTPSILVMCFPLEGLVRTTSSPRVVARIVALLSIAKEPPVKIGPMTFPTSKVVFRGCFVDML